MSLPKVRDGDDDQQVEDHSEQSDVGQQCIDEYGLGSNWHGSAGGVERERRLIFFL